MTRGRLLFIVIGAGLAGAVVALALVFVLSNTMRVGGGSAPTPTTPGTRSAESASRPTVGVATSIPPPASTPSKATPEVALATPTLPPPTATPPVSPAPTPSVAWGIYSDPVTKISLSYPKDWTVNPFPDGFDIMNSRVHVGAHYFFEPTGALVQVYPVDGPMPLSGKRVYVGQARYTGFWIETDGITDTSQAATVIRILYTVNDYNWEVRGIFGSDISPQSPERAAFNQMVQSIRHSSVSGQTPTPTAVAGAESPELTYVTAVESSLSRLKASTDRFTALMVQAQGQPALMLNQQWRSQVDSEFSIWSAESEVLNGLVPPPGYTTYQSQLSQMAGLLTASASDFDTGLNTLDSAKAQSSSQKFHDALATLNNLLPVFQAKRQQLSGGS